MTIHYQMLDEGGICAAYLCRPEGNVDAVVRRALELEDERAIPLAEITRLVTPPPTIPYVVDLGGSMCYGQREAELFDAVYTVQTGIIPNSTTVVGVVIRQALPPPMLQFLAETFCFKRRLIPHGLQPIESARSDIPSQFLRAGF